MKTFFFFYFNKDNVIADLTDAAPGDDIFAFTPGKEAEFAGTGNDQSRNLTGSGIKFQINRTAEAATGTGIDDFFLSKLT